MSKNLKQIIFFQEQFSDENNLPFELTEQEELDLATMMEEMNGDIIATLVSGDVSIEDLNEDYDFDIVDVLKDVTQDVKFINLYKKAKKFNKQKKSAGKKDTTPKKKPAGKKDTAPKKKPADNKDTTPKKKKKSKKTARTPCPDSKEFPLGTGRDGRCFVTVQGKRVYLTPRRKS